MLNSDHIKFLQDHFKWLINNNIEAKRPEYGSQFKFYQSCNLLNLDGLRNTTQRINELKIRDFIQPNFEILDIGCNIGCFDLELASSVKFITGVDLVPFNIFFANEFKNILNIQNVNFLGGNINSIDFSNKKFDFIMVLCLDGSFKLKSDKPFFDLNLVTDLLKTNGILLLDFNDFEHKLMTDGKNNQIKLPSIVSQIIKNYSLLYSYKNYCYLQKI